MLETLDVAGRRSPRAAAPASAFGRRLGEAVFLSGLVLAEASPLGVLLRLDLASDEGQVGLAACGLGAVLLARDLRGGPRGIGADAGPWAAGFAVPGGLGLVYGALSGEPLATIYGGALLALAAGAARFGPTALARAWPALVLILLGLPPPFSLAWALSSALRGAYAGVAVWGLKAVGVAAGRTGSTLFAGSHVLAIEQACSGVTSLFALVGTALACARLRRPEAPPAYFLLLLPIAVLLALAANLARIAVVLALTLGLGEGVAEGPLHPLSGVLMFLLAALGALGAERLLWPVWRRRSR